MAGKKVKVKLLEPRSGEDGAFAAGDVIEFEAADAKRLIEAGQAEAVSASKRDKAEKL